MLFKFVTRYHTFYLVNNQESYRDLRYCLNKEEYFTLGDIMRSCHNVHLRYQNMKYNARVALYKDVKSGLCGANRDLARPNRV